MMSADANGWTGAAIRARDDAKTERLGDERNAARRRSLWVAATTAARFVASARGVSNRPSALRLACGGVVAFHASIADRGVEPGTVRARGHCRDHRRYQIDPLPTSGLSESGHFKTHKRVALLKYRVA